LAEWLWGGAPDQTRKEERLEVWRHALVSGHLDDVGEQAGLRREFCERLGGLDQGQRTRLARECADDVVVMQFLKQDGAAQRDDDWHPVSKGSPGQRTAAMLAFMLHHGSGPLVLDQPEDDLDNELIFDLVVSELRRSRWDRQLIVVTHNANIPVNADAEHVIVMENLAGALQIRGTRPSTGGASVSTKLHAGPIETEEVRHDIQTIMEGGVRAFRLRERRYGRDELENSPRNPRKV